MYFLAILVLAANIASAMQHEPSPSKGKALFIDPKLGSNGKSCNDCHNNGKGLETAGEKKDLVDTVNMCIKKGLKGKGLKPRSVEMQSMVLHIKSFGSLKKEKGKKTPVGC